MREFLHELVVFFDEVEVVLVAVDLLADASLELADHDSIIFIGNGTKIIINHH